MEVFPFFADDNTLLTLSLDIDDGIDIGLAALLLAELLYMDIDGIRQFVFEVLKGGFANQLGDKKALGLFGDHIVRIQFGAIGQVGFELRKQIVESVAAQSGYRDRFFYAEFIFKGLL